MDRLELINRLMAATDDPEELKKLGAERDAILKAEARKEVEAELKAEAEKKDMEAAQKKAAEQNKPAQIIVGAGKTNLYKGFNLNKEVKLAGLRAQANQGLINDRFKRDPDAAMGIAKMFVDAYDAALRSPMNGVQVRAALQEGTDSEGGYLTPTEQRFEVLGYAREKSTALQYATHIPMTSDSMTIPTELTKVTAAITAEESSATESEPTFSVVTLTAKRIDAYGITSNELLDDAAINGGITGLLLDQFIEATGQKIDSAVFLATGDPMSGLFKGGAGYSEVFSSGSTAFSELLESNIRNAVANITDEDNDNFAWYMHKKVLWQYVRGLKDDQGNYLFYDGRNGGAAPANLWGDPVRRSTQMPYTSGASVRMAVYGNLRGVFIGDRLTTFRIMLDPYTKMEYNQTRFFFATRWAFARALPNLFCAIQTAAS